jgi:hypothetical protein
LVKRAEQFGFALWTRSRELRERGFEIVSRCRPVVALDDKRA